MKKKLLIALTGVMMLASFSACGEKEEAATTIESGAVAKSDSVDQPDKSDKKDKEALTLSEAFNPSAGNIWYFVQEQSYGKDAGVKQAYLFEDGKLYVYDLDGKTLGDIAQMSDEEVISMLHTEGYICDIAGGGYTSSMLDEIAKEGCNILPELYVNISEDLVNYPEKSVDIYDEESDNLNKIAEIDNMYGIEFYKTISEIVSKTNPEDICYDSDYTFGIYTDSTGNSVDTMSIQIQRFDGLNSLILREVVSKREKDKYNQVYTSEDYFLYINNMVNYYDIDVNNVSSFDPCARVPEEELIKIYAPLENPVQVYDSYFNGFSSDFGGMQAAFVTKCDESTTFALDSMGTDGIEIDPEWEIVEE